MIDWIVAMGQNRGRVAEGVATGVFRDPELADIRHGSRRSWTSLGYILSRQDGRRK